jgi:hypothetical protein
LLLAMPARVGGIRLQLIDATINDVQTQTALRVSFLNVWLGLNLFIINGVL